MCALGVPSERIYDATGQKANLWASINPAEVPGFILSGHTDVVPVDGQEWSSDPFRLRQAIGRLYARGAGDVKAFLAVCLAALPGMRKARLRQLVEGTLRGVRGTEAGLFQRIAGVPTVVMGPGSIEQAHKAEEWIGLDQLESCATFIGRLVQRCLA